ncbi:MAG TPA: ABC transporter permease [Pyrinomonadaceae bacterium]|nr:ABC transporter permease [Pyrinomonadaceae bacterium]
MLGKLRHRLRALLKKSEMDREMDEEVRFHLEREAEEYVRRGMTPSEARRAALLRFGGVERVREECRQARGVRVIQDLRQDLRYGVRTLLKQPGFTLVAVLTLALGIGAGTTIFSAVNPILFEPLPYPQAERLVSVLETFDNGARNPGTFGMYRGLAERSRSFEALAVYKTWLPSMTGAEHPERFEGQRVSAEYFRVLGIRPALGRDFQPSDDVAGGPGVVIIGDSLWRRRFGGEPGIVGRSVTLDDSPCTIIGVMPGGFENVLAPDAEVWAPLQYDMSLTSAWGHHLRTVGRLRPGVSVEQATRETDALGHAVLDEQRPETYSPQTKFVVSSLKEEVTGSVKPALLAIVSAVLLLLLIACVNVTNLLLARGAQRRGEFAMRAALGAERGRLIRQLLTESLLLALAGGALGLLAAQFGAGVLVALSPPELPRAGAIRVDAAAFAFAFGSAALVGLLVGLVPALHATRGDLREAVQQSSRRTAGGQQLTRRVLVVAEVALALVLLVGAGLLLRSMERLFAVDPGFDTSHLLTMQVQTSRRFDKEATERFYARALEAVRSVPGVTAAAFTNQLPLSGDEDEYGAHFEGDDPGTAYNVFRYAVSPGYLETTGVPLLRGRTLGEHDVAGAPPAILISESLARRRFPGQDPIGHRVHVGPRTGPGFNVVGVVGDVKQVSLASSQPDAVYVTTAQWQFVDRTLSLVVRARGDAAALAPAVRRAVWSVDRDQPIVRVATMDELLAASAAERRFASILFKAFGLAALVLAAVGIYGVLSGSVNERTREIGVRLALGASRGRILALVLRQGMTLTGIGVAAGLCGAAAASGALVSLLYGVSRLDPAAYLGVAALLAAVSAAACWLPAWRAARVDPSITLRSE